MKKEVYSCMKMLEALRKSCVSTFNSRSYFGADGLRLQYTRIYSLLKRILEKEQMEAIPFVKDRILSTYSSEDQKGLIMEVSSACDIAFAYLRSLEGSLDKELSSKENKLNLREQEIDRLEKELKSERKILKKSMDIIKEFQEVLRSGSVAQWKEAHKQIEEIEKERKKIKE